MSQSKQLALRSAAAPGSSFVQGWPGIPAAPGRPGAHVSGHVDVRLGKGLNASWLRVELRKLETIPGGQDWGELIGNGPLTVWRANSTRDPTATSSNPDDPDSDHWQLLTTNDFSFSLPIPEALPPSARVDKQSEIAYELVASLCVRMRRGVFRKKESAVSSIIQTTHPVVLNKHELHPPWFLYNYPDQHDAHTMTESGKVGLTLFMNHHCFGPGDTIDARLALLSEASKPIKAKNVVLTLKETVTFKGSSAHAPLDKGKARARHSEPTPRSSTTASQRVTTIATRSFPPGKKLAPKESRLYDLALPISKHHSLMTISTAKHIEVSYTLRLSMEVNKQILVIDHLPVKISSFSRAESEKILPKIGHVAGLSDPAAAPFGQQQQVPTSTVTPTRTASADGSGSTLAVQREPSMTMSSVGRGPQRSNTMASTSTGLSWAVNRPNVAGRGIQGAFEAMHLDPQTQARAGRYSMPPTAKAGPIAAPTPIRAAFNRSGAITPALAPQEQLALTNEMDRRAQSYGAHQSDIPPVPAIPPGTVPGPSAEAEKERMYMRAAQASHTNQALAAAARAGQVSAAQAIAQGTMSAEEEKAWQYQRARAEAEAYQATFPNAATPFADQAGQHQQVQARDGAGGNSALSAAQATPRNSALLVSATPPETNRATPWLSAEEEKSRLYNSARAQATTTQPSAFEGSSTPAAAAAAAAAPSSSAAAQPAPAGPLSEKEQLRRFLEAQEQVARFQSGLAPSLPSDLDPATLAALSAGAAAAGTSTGASTSAGAGAGAGSSTSVPDGPFGSSSSAPAPALTEKEQLRRFMEAQAQVAQYQSGLAPSLPPELANQAAGSGARDIAGPSSSVPAPALTEKEQLRRFLEAQDQVAQFQAGQTLSPPPELAASQAFASAGTSSSAAPTPVLSEKEQLRRFLEARDQVTQYQSGQGPQCPPELTVTAATSPLEPPTASGSATPALTEKEQVRRFLEAQDQVAQHQNGLNPAVVEAGPGGSSSSRHEDVGVPSEKEQMRRFLEAQDQFAQFQADQATALGAQQAWEQRYNQYETTPVPQYAHIVSDHVSPSGSPALGTSSPVFGQEWMDNPDTTRRSSALAQPSQPPKPGTPQLVTPAPNPTAPVAQPSEKEQMRAFYEARDATVPATNLPAPSPNQSDGHASPVRTPQSRFSYDVRASGAYGTTGALVVDRSAPASEYDPVIASNPWGSARPVGPPPAAPPRPPKF